MRHIFQRLLKNPFIYLMLSAVLVFIFVTSLQIFRTETCEDEVFWPRFNFNGVLTKQVITDELRILDAEIDKLEAITDAQLVKANETALKRMKDQEGALNYLLESGVELDMVADGNIADGNSANDFFYIGMIIDKLLKPNLALTVIIVLLVVGIGKQNGTYSLECLMYGRRKVFWEQFGAATVSFLVFMGSQCLFLFLMRFQFRCNAKYRLFYHDGVYVLKTIGDVFWLEFFCVLLSAFLFFLCIFALAQIINNIWLFCGLGVFLAWLVDNGFFIERTTLIESGWLMNSSILYTLGVPKEKCFGFLALKIGVALLLMIIAYAFTVGRNIRTKYD